jgi:ribosome maturation factor RimP
MKWPKEKIAVEIEKCILDENVFLVDWKLSEHNLRYQLKVKLESDSGISMSQLSEVNRRINHEFSLPNLDIENVTVEVTSPGINTSIKSLRHFRRYIGHLLFIKYKQEEKTLSVEGTLAKVSDDKLEFSLENETLAIPYSQIIEGHLVLKW